ncbi:hypothetical protein SMACR_03962 [Sordaria macrospora]|uniref:Phosphoinositide phospholipase C n=2 Tax=Sordaria macrospora TaxID=5147 RepID=F7W0F8_SORMK|nr:putative phosphoinositide-specific phospholipase C [Sordaria macrospora k-hell]KAA8635009.1 hypothetical protein SMACR_03962 [Sordaria macrospora]KAH7633292.1 putative phosphoinositide-specific phospholipase C [Sordaria sp. MPI-SDFR-AT-0083]WPJ60300.1 hypothetical protein SMAC4_03962 [Sordaria macrospora]CCC11258.1 putative phosphoinositide-specific phospholipase C [Sordaria macrospora k-hell]
MFSATEALLVSHNSPSTLPQAISQAMASNTSPPRRARPAQVHTTLTLQPHVPTSIPPLSATSTSSASPTSQQPSPALTPDTAVAIFTESSSLQDSPATFASSTQKETDSYASTTKGMEDPVTPLNLPEPLAPAPLSSKTSSTSLKKNGEKVGEKIPRQQNAMGEALAKSSFAGSLVRRASNTVNKARDILTRRASMNTINRDADPMVASFRRGSNTFPLGEPNYRGYLLESDDECAIDDASPFDGLRDAQIPLSIGPEIPVALRQGVILKKISKKKKEKRITLTIDPDTSKIWWDKSRSGRKSVFIDDIKEVRTAEDIRQYRLDAGVDESEEPRFFSILYTVPEKSGTKVLHLIALNSTDFRNWVTTLNAILQYRQDFTTNLMASNEKAVHEFWQRQMRKKYADRNTPAEGETIELPDIERICRSLHMHLSPTEIRDNFNAAKAAKAASNGPCDPTSPSNLNFNEFKEFVRLLKARTEITVVFETHTANPKAGMTRQEFMHFLKETQCENVEEDLTHWNDIFSQFARKRRSKDAEQTTSEDESLVISEAGFTGFLTSRFNNLLVQEPSEYVLDRPMNEYYISSSHNTYLLGRQVRGISSVEGYISALERGCRCVEVDCWDGPNDEPYVSHGHTWTTRIKFEEVIKTINKYAFVKSRFPLWISLEVRCSTATQANMAKIMIDIFGDKLVRAPLDPSSDRLPSPSELIERILIKVKKSQPVPSAPSEESLKTERPGRRRGNSLPSPYQRSSPLSSPMDNTPIAVPGSPSLSPSPLSRSTRQINTITEGEVHSHGGPSSSPSEYESDAEKESGKKVVSKINPVLGELGVYCMGVHFDGFDSPDAKRFNHIFSFKEKTFAERSQPGEAKRALYRHNMRYLMRVYPNGGRISSSNFDPLLYWKRGVQMAALNWQTFDLGMQLNQAMFDSGTDLSGYVLKPLEGRQIQVVPTDAAGQLLGKRPRKKISFKIEVISAQQLMRPLNHPKGRTLDPYVEVEIFLADDKRNKQDGATNAPAQETLLKYRTDIVKDNGFNPVFKGNNSYEFTVTTKYPDLIFVRWSVKLGDHKGYNDRSPPLATFTAKLGGLKQGYRTIPLLDHNGYNYLFSTLFCKITKSQPTDIMVAYSSEVPRNSVSRIKNIFNQSGISPKSSMDSGRT